MLLIADAKGYPEKRAAKQITNALREEAYEEAAVTRPEAKAL